MKTFGKRMGCLLLGMMLTGLTACSGGGDTSPSGGEISGSSSSSSKSAATAMGRYIEKEYAWPAGTVTASGIVSRPDGTLEIIASAQELKRIGPWSVYTSSDGGKTWSEREAPWLAELTDNIVLNNTAYDRDGNLYLLTTLFTEEYEKLIEEAMKTGVMPSPDQIPPYLLYRVSPDGTLTQLPMEWRTDESGMVNVGKFVVTQSGELVINQYDQGVVRYDLATGTESGQFSVNYPNDLLTYANTVGMVTDEGIRQFDLDTGDEMDAIPLDEAVGRVLLSVTPDEKSLVRCDGSGVYRWVLGGNIWERIVDGSLTSLNLPSVQPESIIAKEEDEYLVLISNDDDYSTINFSYSADTPTVPDQELSIYSLDASDTIRQAVGLMQTKNPDLLINYEPVLGTNSAMTTSDAVRALNTQLLAGKGPDVLILDSLPIQSYLSKGVLADLSDTVHLEGLCQNVAKTYEKDGKLYAIPTRFAVPQLWSTQDCIDKAKDFTSFVDWAQANSGRNILIESSPRDLIEELYLSCAPAWRNEDGSIRAQEFGQFLTDVKRLADLREPVELSEEQKQSLTPTVKAMSWASTGSEDEVQALTYLSQTFDDMAFPDAISALRGDAAFSLMPGQSRDVYVPEHVIGINAGSPLLDQAKEFVSVALSEKVQQCDFEDGYPVNVSALEASAAYPYLEGDDGMQIQVFQNGEERWVQVLWPSDGFMKARVSQFQNLSTPSTMDAVLLEMIQDETKDFFTGAKSLDATIDAVISRTQAYLSE